MAQTVEDAILRLKSGTRRGTRTRRTQILSLLRVPFRQPGRISGKIVI